MNKSEFLEILQQQLNGEMPANEIYSNIHYYDEYIEREIASGKSEEEVLGQLGDPRLIAKTLIDADEVSPYYNETYEETSYSYGSNDYNRYEQNYTANDSQEMPSHRAHHLDLTTWHGKLLLILGAAVVLFLLITVLSALLPFAIVATLIWLVISSFKRRQ